MKSKILKLTLFIMIIIAFCIIIPNVVNAEVEYTRVFPGSDGSITLNLTGLELDLNKQYLVKSITKSKNWLMKRTISLPLL